jgi:hypothetical protein
MTSERAIYVGLSLTPRFSGVFATVSGAAAFAILLSFDERRIANAVPFVTPSHPAEAGC